MFRQLFQSAQPLSANAFQETKCFLEVKESGNASNRPVELLLPCSEGHVLPLQCWLPASASTMPVKAGSASAACTVQAVVKLFKLIQPPDCLVEVQLCTCTIQPASFHKNPTSCPGVQNHCHGAPKPPFEGLGARGAGPKVIRMAH